MALLDLEKIRRDVNILFGYVKCLMAKEDETSPLVATEWSGNHSVATGNPYTAGTYVFYNGHVFKCKANNDGIPTSNTTYWLDLGEGHLLAEEQPNWNATGGRRYILNKPTNTSDFANDGEDGTSPYVTQDEMNAALPDPQNLDEVLAEGDSAPTRNANVKEIGLWDSFAAPFGYAKIYADKSRIWFKSKLGNNMFNIGETGWAFIKNPWTYNFTFPTLTSNRTATFQDKSGVVAYLSDITGGTGGIPHTTASGTDAYTATVSGVTSYADGDVYLVRFPIGNTSSCTLNINALGAIPLYRNNDGPLIGGDIVAGAEMLCIYNSTAGSFQCIGTSPNSLFAYVTNDDSVTITKGQVVYAFSGTGDRMTVKLANNTGDATSAQTVGLVMSTSIAANQKGLIMMQGLLDGLSILPTSTWSDGDAVYLGNTPGSITSVKPYAPNHLVYLGVVTTASNGSAGRMYVRVQNGYELDEIHNVDLKTNPPSDKQLLAFETLTGLWKNKSISDILGYTPFKYLNSTQVTYTGASIGLTETAVAYTMIPAGTFNANDIFKLLYKVSKPATVSGVTIRVRVSPTNNLATATQMGTLSLAAANTYGFIGKNNNLAGGNMYCYNVNSSLAFDILATNTVGNSVPYDTTLDLHVFFTLQFANTADSLTFQLASITN